MGISGLVVPDVEGHERVRLPIDCQFGEHLVVRVLHQWPRPEVRRDVLGVRHEVVQEAINFLGVQSGGLQVFRPFQHGLVLDHRGDADQRRDRLRFHGQ